MGLSGDRTYRTRAVTFVLLQGCVRAEEFRNTNTYALNFFLGGGVVWLVEIHTMLTAWYIRVEH